MNKIRVHFRAVVISVLLLAIILCSIVLYTMETGRTPTAKAVTTSRAPEALIVANPVVAVTTVPIEPLKTTIDLSVDGITVTVTSTNPTVADFLRIAGLEVGNEDSLSSSLDTKLMNGSRIELTRTLHRITTENVEIPYETEYIDDDDMYEGDEEVEQYGITGSTLNTYDVTVYGGKVASKKLIASKDTADPQTEIIRRGTMEKEEEYEDEEEDPAYEDESEDEAESAAETEDYEEPVTPAPTVTPEPEEDSTEETFEEEPTEETEEPISSSVTFDNDYQRYAYDLFPNYGWTDDDFEALKELWWHESHWNPTSRNAYSGAYGIPQALPGSRMASHGDDWETNGYVQVAWGLDYIAGRYGSPSVAWSYFCSRGWY